MLQLAHLLQPVLAAVALAAGPHALAHTTAPAADTASTSMTFEVHDVTTVHVDDLGRPVAVMTNSHEAPDEDDELVVLDPHGVEVEVHLTPGRLARTAGPQTWDVGAWTLLPLPHVAVLP